MPDRGTVMSAPERARKSRTGKEIEATSVRPLRVKVGGVTVDAVTVRDALYQPTLGDDVNTVPLSDGTVLLLGPASP